MEGVVRRLRWKQPAPAEHAIPAPVLAALRDEAWSELAALNDDARRKHIHWVHVRTHDPTHRQPDSFTREEFWRHMERVYKDVYPNAANRTGSILLFGLVAKERHQASAKQAERDEHHHCPCYTSLQHYWRPVARRSLALGVKLHAACHDGYTVMYGYVKTHTNKKALSELDQQVWFSEDHPKGDLLQKLLEAGANATRWVHKRKAPGETQQSRRRVTDLYQLSQQEGLRAVCDLRQYAHDQDRLGDATWAEFCTSHREEDLQMYLDNAWKVHEPQAQQVLVDRVQRLREATAKPCECHGTWEGGIRFILHHHQEPVQEFCRDVLRALSQGAARGLNLAIVGVPGCGKSTVFESLGKIFKVSAKPETGSTFALSGIQGADVLLWQEFAWDPKGCAFEDLLAVLCGEHIGLRMPGKPSVVFKNNAPMFYTSWQPLSMKCADGMRMANLNAGMAERFKTRYWMRALPQEGRVTPYPHCAKCFAKFILDNSASD
jgi:hypothetical protein